jgi:hypothetical protein
MTVRTWKFVALALAMALGCGFLMAQTRSGAQTAQPAAPNETGRFQIVNGTPEMAHNIMLLDTWTGRTWMTCHDSSSGNDGWCPLPQFSSPPGTNSPQASAPPAPHVLPGVD